MRLGGKKAIVTGAGSGIGRACVERFLDEGAQVVLVDLDTSALTAVEAELRDRYPGDRLVTVSGDVRDETVIASALEACTSFGAPNVLVNNAGFGIDATVLETSRRQWDDIVSVNLTAVFEWSKAVIPVMAAAGGGSIVNVSSNLAQVGTRRRAAYSATKAAVDGLSRGMAIDHAHLGIRVNVVAPGTTATPYFEKIAPNVQDRAAFEAQLAERQVLGRLGSPREIAEAIVFLASDESAYATGSVLTVDGGWSIW